MGLPEEAFRKFEFPNCGVAEVIWNPGEQLARMWRWVYPTPSPWKAVEETRLEIQDLQKARVHVMAREAAAVSATDVWDLRGASTAPPARLRPSTPSKRDWKVRRGRQHCC